MTRAFVFGNLLRWKGVLKIKILLVKNITQEQQKNLKSFLELFRNSNGAVLFVVGGSFQDSRSGKLRKNVCIFQAQFFFANINRKNFYFLLI